MEMVPYRRMPGRWPWRRRRVAVVPAVRLVLPRSGWEPKSRVSGVPTLPAGWVPVVAPACAVGADELRVRAFLRLRLGVVL
jgi:hypothetical protein